MVGYAEAHGEKKIGFKRSQMSVPLIGAYAMRKGGLITRNEDDFRSLYPTLNIYNPVRANT